MLKFNNFLLEFSLTLKYHNKLNPKIWSDGSLKEELSEPLVQGALDFVDFSNVDRSRIKDMILTGGNANYNYTKFSDLDVHIMCDTEGLVKDELFAKKSEWKKTQNACKLAGYEVEYYIDEANPHIPGGQGVYSLLKKKWLIIPKHLESVDVLKDPTVLEKVEFYTKYVRNYLLKKGTEQEIMEFRLKLRNMRQAGLQEAGEFSIENIIFKDLRNRGLIDKLKQRVHELREKK